MSVAIRLMGGLGNMMFQIATGEYWRKMGHDVVYTNMDENLTYISQNYTPKRHSETYKNLFPNFDWNKYRADKRAYTPRKISFTFTAITPSRGIEYIGYFQSEQNFPNRELISRLFQWHDGALLGAYLYMPTSVNCSIHVRRRDYLSLQEYHPVLDMDYYNKAMDILRPFNIKKFLVFSDDIEWCKENFHGDIFEFYDVHEGLTMCMMSMCNHNIIANSSLSWWGAYLGGNNNRVVIAPERWFGPKGENSRDIIPAEWVKL